MLRINKCGCGTFCKKGSIFCGKCSRRKRCADNLGEVKLFDIGKKQRSSMEITVDGTSGNQRASSVTSYINGYVCGGEEGLDETLSFISGDADNSVMCSVDEECFEKEWALVTPSVCGRFDDDLEVDADHYYVDRDVDGSDKEEGDGNDMADSSTDEEVASSNISFNEADRGVNATICHMEVEVRGDGYNSTLMTDEVIGRQRIRCRNCMRPESVCKQAVEEYTVVVESHPVGDVRFGIKQLLTFSKKECSGMAAVPLCMQCKHVLSKEKFDNRNRKDVTWVYAWPAYMWVMISNEEVIEAVGGHNVLRIIPAKWREYWIDTLIAMYRCRFIPTAREFYISGIGAVVVDITLKSR
jgi:uncharacterized Zn finger protein (UPF0148 family)